ncbi:dihydrofolate reductase [Halalkalibacter urbisdiaboli]|uniref:dihydrofolate reductase n=1 Tax=Halalkalibacter urbisdiaboli TaxID=1960589 RepID=UPI000B446101|nr:dihydrofolate reductase [Halalkalibacter urbisdiaboli]
MISFIFAMDEQRTIGKDNDLPWHLPADLAFFKRTTLGHTIVMGRKTYESIGRPLPKRRNVVLTRSQDFQAPGCEVVHSVDEVKALSNEDEELFIIGGTELFKLFWNDVDRLYVTKIHETFEGDTFFPEISEADWKLVSVEKGKVDEKNRHAHDFCLYERKG